MKRGTSWGRGVSQFPGLQARRDCGVEPQELGARAAENPRGCSAGITLSGPPPSQLSALSVPRQLPRSLLPLCVSVLDPCSSRMRLPGSSTLHWASVHASFQALSPSCLPNSLLISQFKVSFPPCQVPCPSCPLSGPSPRAVSGGWTGTFHSPRGSQTWSQDPVMLLEITKDPKEFLFMGLCLLIFTTLEMKLRNHKIFILEEQ